MLLDAAERHKGVEVEFNRRCVHYEIDKGVLTLADETTGSEWNFQGCAISGKMKGTCLEAIPMLKDYWFDWRNYNPRTTVYGKQ